MSTDDPRETSSGPLAQAGAAVAGLAEAWLRDTAYVAVGLLALVTVICGVAAGGAGYVAAGVVAGLGAFGIPTAAMVRRCSPGQVWVALLVGAAVGAGGLALVLLGG